MISCMIPVPRLTQSACNNCFECCDLIGSVISPKAREAEELSVTMSLTDLFPEFFPPEESVRVDATLDYEDQTHTFPELAEYFADVFINRWDIYTTQHVHKGEAPYCYHRSDDDDEPALNSFHVEQHLLGKITMGIICVDQNGCSRFFCWDEDNMGGRLDRFGAVLTDLGIQFIRVTGRINPVTGAQERAGHLFVLFKKPIHARDLELFRREIEIRAGIQHPANAKCACCRKGLDHFPFTTDLDAEPKFSNLRAPLGINRKPKAGWNRKLSIKECDFLRGWFVGPPKNIMDQLLWLREQKLNSPKKIQQIIRIQKVILKECLNFDREFERLKHQSQKRLIRLRRVRGLKRIRMLELIKAYCEVEGLKLRKSGSNLLTACPLCGEIEDGAGDNLMIEATGKKFNCFAGSSSGTHSARDVYIYLLKNYGKPAQEGDNKWKRNRSQKNKSRKQKGNC